MSDTTTMTDPAPEDVPNRYRRGSAWPPFVALGFAISETGIFLGLVPVAIGGILLFGGSLAGILVDSSVADSPWKPLGLVGSAFTVGGVAIWLTQVHTYAVSAMLAVASTNAVAMRGEAILVGGVLLLLGAVGGSYYKPQFSN